MKTAISRTDMIINRLIKKEQLEQFQAEIQKKIDIGCLEQVPETEIEDLLKRTHHFCYLQLVFSESSESTSTRMINNMLTTTPNGTSFSIENKVPVSEIGDSHESLLNFLLYRFGYSSDISKCYLHILVDELTADLRLMAWYEDPKNKKGLIIYRRKTMDFGDAASALIVRITQKKFISPMAKLEATKHTVLAGGYADNY